MKLMKLKFQGPLSWWGPKSYFISYYLKGLDLLYKEGSLENDITNIV